jgi:signal transduction histidine kinase
MPVNIRFLGGVHTFPHIPVWQLFDGQVSSDAFKDRIVLIGLTADGQDQWFTPFSTRDGQKMSGVEIHANAIDTFYAGRSISQVPDIALFVLLFALSLLFWWLDRRFEGLRFYFIAFLMIPGTVVLSWLLMKFASVWLAFPPLWTAIVFVVPGLEVIELIRVNHDLDSKIERLSAWDSALRGRGVDEDPRSRIVAGMPEGPARTNWLQILETAEKKSKSRALQRKRLLSASSRNARWRLQAVDFFNEDLVQFLSFNNAILASIEDVIIVADPGGRVVYQNPAAHRLDGYSERPPFVTDYLGSLLDGRNLLSVFGEVLGGMGTANLEFIPSHHGKRYYNLMLAPISNSGVVISLHDTSPQYELNQAKNDMVSLVSHELRTPLTAIRGYSDMLVKYDLVAEKGKPFLATIISEVRRLNGLIQSFLDIAYIESGRQKITVSEFDLGPFINDMTTVLGPVAAEKHIHIQTALESPEGRIRGDRLLLYQAVSNLLTNAIKYSPPDTMISLNVRNGDGRIRFHVSDRGYGIPPNETAKIFEKFYRRSNKETRDQNGFGLGLAFVKEVALKHNGDVGVESEVGKGSTFTLWIPNE